MRTCLLTTRTISISTLRLLLLWLLLSSAVLIGRRGASASSSSSSSSRRNDGVFTAMTKWAQENGIVMHENLHWKRYTNTNTNDEDNSENNNNNNWGLELKEPVPPGTTLLQVPGNLVLDSECILNEFMENTEEEEEQQQQLQKAFEKLGDYIVHKEQFLIFIKLLRCSREQQEDDEGSSSSPSQSNQLWLPWIRALPRQFPELCLTDLEKECLPYYAKYAANYQEKKFEAFCLAAAELLEDGDESSLLSKEKLNWAFHSVGSRCWKTTTDTQTTKQTTNNNNNDGDDDDNNNNIIEQQQQSQSSTELVPLGDMFNHRDPPNVAITHDKGRNMNVVNFVYKGDTNSNNGNDDDANTNKDLYITYGLPSNPHRFLAVFGFVPNAPVDMPYVWSHVSYPNNPFSAHVDKMVFRVVDGMVPKIVWDAVLYALLQPPKEDPVPVYTQEQHIRYKEFTLDVLRNHVSKNLDELKSLRKKIDSIAAAAADENGQNLDLIRQHNELLSTVFSRVQKYLEDDTNIDFDAEL